LSIKLRSAKKNTGEKLFTKGNVWLYKDKAVTDRWGGGGGGAGSDGGVRGGGGGIGGGVRLGRGEKNRRLVSLTEEGHQKRGRSGD